jgi:Uma2 family endonuclease
MAIGKKLYTVDEFETFIAQPENQDRRFELRHGEIVEKMTPTEEHGFVATKLTLRGGGFAEKHNLGRWVIETRYRQPEDDHNSRIPDISFTSRARLQPLVRKGAVPQLPDLAIEIKSPDDTYTKMRESAAYYISSGVRMVWLIFPEKQLIEVYQRDHDIQILNMDDTLDGGAVLPGFQVAVRDVFTE